jgi:hypothetical protein
MVILKVGQVQNFVFTEGERPFNDVTSTPHDRFEAEMTEAEIKKCKASIAKAEEKAVTENKNPADVDRTIVVRGFIGQPKGIEQILRERGLYCDGMVMSKTKMDENKLRLQGKPVPDASMYLDRVLGACTDFREEISALDSLIYEKGHIILRGVKCHPEMAGCGVEYVLGASKRYFRKESDCQASTLNSRVLRSLQPDVIPLSMQWKFERRARLYMFMYRKIAMEGASADLTSYVELEKRMVAMKSTHRNIIEIESAYLKRLSDELDAVQG